MSATPGILTSVLNAFDSAMGAGFMNLQPTAHWLLATLFVIDLTIWGLWYALGGDGVSSGLAQFLRKIIIASALIGLVTAWPHVADRLVYGFMWIGRTAGGGGGPAVTHPSAIMGYGWYISTPIIDKIAQESSGTFGAIANIGPIILYEIALLLTLGAFFVLAIQCFLAYLGFELIAVLTLALIPFAVWKHTRFLGEKAFGALISHGIKLMVLTFIIAVAGPVFVHLMPPSMPTFEQAFQTAVAALAIVMLAMQAPTLAAGLLGGSPSLGAGAMAGAAMGAGAGMALAATGAGAAAGLAKTGSGAAAKAAGAIHEGMKGGLNAMNTGGSSTMSEKLGGMAFGGAGVVAGAAARKVASPAEFLRQKFGEGQLATASRSIPAAPSSAKTPVSPGPSPTGGAGVGAAGSTTPPSGGAAPAPTTAPASVDPRKANPSPDPRKANPASQNARQLAQHVKEGDASGAGVQPSLPKDDEQP